MGPKQAARPMTLLGSLIGATALLLGVLCCVAVASVVAVMLSARLFAWVIDRLSD